VAKTDATRASEGEREAPASRTAQETPADVRHLLDRFAFGPRPGEVEAVLAQGTRAWFEHQLRADELPDPRAERAVWPYRRALAPPDRLPDLFAKAGAPLEMPTGETPGRKNQELRKQMSMKQLLLELQMAEIARHIESEYQLREVMVDFFSNHFNVYAKKDEVQLLAGDYVERVIRPLALGSFEELLLATARHPAMLRYLDNASSRARPRRSAQGLPGITENYARELLELHTLGVDGGYDQADVIAVARVLTGWTFVAGVDGRGATFVFDARRHDQGKKVVLGTEFSAGEAEGLRLLRMLALHPATASHLAHKLCVRFVADQPPPECTEPTTRAFLASGGDIKATLLALFESPAFFAEEHRRTKLKTSLEFLLSAVRGTGARLAGTTGLAQVATRLGEAPHLERSPKGRVEEAPFWLESYTLARLGFAQDLAFGRVPGVVLDGRAASAGECDPPTLMASELRPLLGDAATAHTTATIEAALLATSDASERCSAGVALALSSPEFQWR